MSWRFRKSFKVIPGVRLNLTARGLSATFGAAPFSINVGPRGVYRNVSIPGTGIWDRQRIDGPSSLPPRNQLPSPDGAGVPSSSPVPPSVPVPPQPATEIHSASTELLTSESLEQLRRLLMDAYNERDELTREISTATSESNSATRRYQNWEHGFLMKRLFKQSFVTRKETAETATAKLEELQEQLRLTTIATEIAVDREQAEPYYRMRDAFSALSECQKVWNVLTEKAIDRIAERSNANTAVTRTSVSFSLNACDLIQWEQKVPHLPNRTGGDMFIYPGFILYRASKQAFALIDSRDVSLRFVSTQFTETDPVPSDSQIVGHSWAKCNKDGSPDRRFRDNYQIPVARYGTLLFTTADGLDVRYICSNTGSAEEFVEAWVAFQMMLNPQSQRTESTSGTQSGDIVNIKRTQDACERLMVASTEFQKATSQFINIVVANAKPRDGGGSTLTFTSEQFSVYRSAVIEVIGAAKLLMDNSPFVSSSAKSKFRRAIETIEASWSNVLPQKDGPINGDGLVPVVNAAGAFVNSCAEYFAAVRAGFGKTAAPKLLL